MNELKRCPFCGGEVKLMAIAGEPFPPTYEVELDKITSDSDDICYIHCPTCGANWHKEVRIESFPLDTIKAWNTRKPMERILERLNKKVNFVDGKITQKIHCGHQVESDQQFMNGVMYATIIVKEEGGIE